jgi:hypothetical protein
MDMNIKGLIKINKFANENISQLEKLCADIKIKSDKDKANFGNVCVALRGFRMVAEATEAMLVNEDVLQDENGNFYQKIEDEDEKVISEHIE